MADILSASYFRLSSIILNYSLLFFPSFNLCDLKMYEKSFSFSFCFLSDMFHFFFSSVFSLDNLQVKVALDVTILVRGEI